MLLFLIVDNFSIAFLFNLCVDTEKYIVSSAATNLLTG